MTREADRGKDMRMYDLIIKKRNGEALSKEEISYIIKEYVSGNIPDYQMSAFLMAVYFKGMTKEETLAMTMEVAKSGDMVDLSSIEGVKVDKHSTGGVGDKTTLIIAPIVASYGVKVAKMSGRGLGHTGGTVDKLEAIPNFKTSLDQKEFFDIVNKIGVSVIGQSGNLAPADKKLYALRDVTATVDSIPLIAVSIMSKKLAAGNDCILLDVKTGSGAFMKTIESSIELAKEMVDIGANAGKNTLALITDMDIPLGKNIGNSLEVIEAIETLQGRGPSDLTEVCIQLAANMLYLADKGTNKECEELVRAAIADGRAYNKFIEMVEAQGGDSSVIKDISKFEKAKYTYDIKADLSGYISAMDTESLGISSVMLGAGRETKDSTIDYSAGIIIHKKYGDFIKENDIIATLYANDESLFEAASKRYTEAITISDKAPKNKALIYARVSKDEIIRY